MSCVSSAVVPQKISTIGLQWRRWSILRFVRIERSAILRARGESTLTIGRSQDRDSGADLARRLGGPGFSQRSSSRKEMFDPLAECRRKRLAHEMVVVGTRDYG